MSFALKQHETVEHAFHRLAGKQLAKAHAALADADDPADALHDVRKATKRVRAIARVVRPGIAARRYRQLNALAREAAAELSAGRDAQALVVSFDALVAWSAGGFVGQDAARAELVRRAEHAAEGLQADPSAVVAAMGTLAAAQRLVAETAVRGNRRLLHEGLHDVHRAARRAHRACDGAADDDDEQWHEWRKRTKYLWHAVQLVEPASPAMLHPTTKVLHHVADALGDDHDLAVLTGLVHQRPWAFGSEHGRDGLLTLIAAARADLHRRAWIAGSRLLAERSDAFADRLVATWSVWDRDEEVVVGGLADLAQGRD